jgi:transcriptional regulator with XRE-family HTH domain
VDIRKQVGLNVKKIRLERGWSQEKLGFESGLDRTYISGIERGARNPTILVLKEIADALAVRPMTLLDDIRAETRGRRL